MYYNEDVKKRYIALLGTEYAELVFSKFADTEQEYSKDLAEFNEAEIKALFSTSSSINTLRKLCSFLETYTNYYIENEIKDTSAVNGYSLFTDNDLKDFLKETQGNVPYISREQLLQMIAEIPNAIDRFLILALYEGIRGEKYSDITMLKVDDIDIVEQAFNLPSGKKVKVSSELFDTAIKAAQSKFYRGLKENYTLGKTVSLGENEYIFRARSNAKNSDTDVDKKAVRVAQKFIVLKKFLNDNNFSVSRVFNSGYVYQLKEIKKNYPDKEWKEMGDLPEVMEIHKKYNMTGTFVPNLWRLKVYFDE